MLKTTPVSLLLIFVFLWDDWPNKEKSNKAINITWADIRKIYMRDEPKERGIKQYFICCGSNQQIWGLHSYSPKFVYSLDYFAFLSILHKFFTSLDFYYVPYWIIFNETEFAKVYYYFSWRTYIFGAVKV